MIISTFSTAFPTGPAYGTSSTVAWADFAASLLARRQGEKDGPNFVPARFVAEDDGRVRRLKANLVARTAIVLDIETNKETGEVPPPFEEVMANIELMGWCGAIYTSHNHTPLAERYRVVLPLSAEIASDLPAPEIIASVLGLRGVLDESKIGAASLFYLPSAAPGALAGHAAEVIEGRPVDAAWLAKRSGALLAEREAARAAERAEAAEAAARRRTERIRAGFDPDASLIEAVRQRLDLEDELARHGYEPAGEGRFLYPGSESGVPGVYAVTGSDGVQRAFSHHASDPLAAGNLPSWCRSKAVDAVDVVTILDHGGDLKVALRTMAKRFGLERHRPAGSTPAEDFGPGEPATTPDDLADEKGIITEDSVALAFTIAHRNDLRFCHHAGAWYRWDGAIWRREESKLAFAWARTTARRLAKADSTAKAIGLAGKAAFAAGVERFAQSDRAHAVTSEVWDADPWLLGTPGGTVDLRTGDLRPARQADHITKATAVAPADSPDCPRWLAFLEQATNGDQALVGFLRRWFGYTLTGITREHALLFVHGDGGNGKGVAMNTAAGIMGAYAVNAAADTFTANKGERHPTDLAMLAGARMVMTTEVDEGQVWAEARLKALTGGDPVTARFMRGDFFTYMPSFKLTISGNHRPALRNVDSAARRRFNLAPFVHKPAVPDKELTERLKVEWPGILRWMIGGCLEWQRDGLQQPDAVRLATEEYFEEQDTIGKWLAERCTIDPAMHAKPGNLLDDCRHWAARNGEAVPTPSQFRSAVERVRGIRWAKVAGQRLFKGVGLNPPSETGMGG